MTESPRPPKEYYNDPDLEPYTHPPHAEWDRDNDLAKEIVMALRDVYDPEIPVNI